MTSDHSRLVSDKQLSSALFEASNDEWSLSLALKGTAWTGLPWLDGQQPHLCNHGTKQIDETSGCLQLADLEPTVLQTQPHMECSVAEVQTPSTISDIQQLWSGPIILAYLMTVWIIEHFWFLIKMSCFVSMMQEIGNTQESTGCLREKYGVADYQY